MTAADGPVIFTNIAFSEKRPTWRGWSRDTGDLTISSGRIVIEGLKRQLMIEAPFVAGFRDEKYSYWPMIELSGSMAPIWRRAPTSLCAGCRARSLRPRTTR